MAEEPLDTVALSQADCDVPGEPTRAERWRQRMEAVSSAMLWLAPRARPVAEQAAKIARGAGQVAGTVIKTGGTVIGVGVAGIGIVAVGGPAGATVAAVGAGIGASSWVGGWFAEKVGEGVGLGIDLSGVITEQSLYVSDTLLQGLHSVLTKSQTALLLGDEGAAVLEHVMEVHKESREVASDATYLQLVRGVIAYTCLQRAMNVKYSNRGFVATLAEGDEMAVPRGPAAFKRESNVMTPSGGETEGVDELKEVLRQVEMAHAVYGAVHNALVGDGSVEEVLGGNKAMAARFLELTDPEDVIAARWHSPGPHSPVFILVADRRHGTLVLSVRGTMSSGDVLTDLRCRSSLVRLEPERAAQAVHLGMWDSAVRLDAELSDQVEQALAGPCAGLQLRVTGHSLGAGVASLLALRWKRRFPGVRCLAFAPPCTMSLELSEECREVVTSVVLADDVVARWSLGSTKDLLRVAASLGKEEGALQRLLRITLLGGPAGGSWREARKEQAGGGGSSAEEHGGETESAELREEEEQREAGAAESGSEDEVWCLSLARTLEADMQEPKLYPAGRVLWLVRERPAAVAGGSEEFKFRVTEKGAGEFGRLVLSRGMLSDHLIHNYDHALRALLPPSNLEHDSEARSHASGSESA